MNDIQKVNDHVTLYSIAIANHEKFYYNITSNRSGKMTWSKSGGKLSPELN